ncbi:MAG: TetR/AcrR family transcriptional regulator [Bacteroidota bacterium]
MKTKAAIKAAACQLFNTHGVLHVTLRDIAKQLDKSYGNITYHFPNKQSIIQALFEDYHADLAQLPTLYDPHKSLLEFFLELPSHSYEITTRYIFLTKDYLELRRSFPEFFEIVEALNNARKVKWLRLMIQLQTEGWLRADMDQNTLEYIMELSVSLRMFYFQSQDIAAYDHPTYCLKVNQLLWPYLSEKALSTFNNWLKRY